MKPVVLCLIISTALAGCLPGNGRRFMLVGNNEGGIDTIDLLSQPITLTAQLSHVTYYVYTKNVDDPFIINNGDINQLSNSRFDASKRTVFIIHGWNDAHTADVNQLVKAAIFKRYDINVVVVDWSPVAKENYSTAKGAVVSVGRFVGEFINEIMGKYGLGGSQFILIGHSLGAHIAGNAGSVTIKSVDYIIGLDPAAPLFSVENTEERLDPSDADYVQVIHTNGRFLGFDTSIGHADFYPNGGMIQAGCGLDLLGVCSHARSFQFLAEAIESDTAFVATLCGSYDDFKKGKCNNNRKVNMAEIDIDKSVVGDYFLATNSDPPFAVRS